MAKPRQRADAPAPHHPTISPDLALRRLKKLLEQIPEVRSSGYDSVVLSTWQGNVKILLAEQYGENSLVFKEFGWIRFAPITFYDVQPESEYVNSFNSGLDQATGFLESRVSDLAERVEQKIPSINGSVIVHNPNCRRVFVVHGHDHGTKETVARFLETLELEPVILHEQANEGKTIIEKFETHAADVQCALVILTPDDIASSKTSPEQKEHRARQNVILELGFFVGKLGRGRTFALVEKGVTLPSDIHGVIYIPLDDERWRLRLVKELKAVGISVDANRAF